MISGDATKPDFYHEFQSGIYILARYDDNYEVVYEHVHNKKYTLNKTTLGDKVRGWFVRILFIVLKL